MAQKRRRKHRGTQAGTVEARGRTSRPSGPRTAAAPAKTARERREQRLNRAPTWRGSINRALLAAIAFGLFIAFTAKSHDKLVTGVALGAVVFLFYLPMTYYLDRFMYRRRQRRRAGPVP